MNQVNASSKFPMDAPVHAQSQSRRAMSKFATTGPAAPLRQGPMSGSMMLVASPMSLLAAAAGPASRKRGAPKAARGRACPTGSSAKRKSARRSAGRRAVASVLAMMFMVVFGSLAAVMAVVAQGNLRTADSSLKLSRAMSAAETGLVFAARRLREESARFVVEKGVVDADFCEDLWMGTVDQGADGAVDVLPHPVYTAALPLGIVHAIYDTHAYEDALSPSHSFDADSSDASFPQITGNRLQVKPIRLTTEQNPPYFRLTYELVPDEPAVLVTSEGVDGQIRRTLRMQFDMEKKIEFAVLAPNRIMIGKNVLIEGPLGSLYGVDTGTNDPNPDELDATHGDPLIMRSDFFYLDDGLNDQLSAFLQSVVAYDADGDGRLRPGDPAEAAGLGSYSDYDGNEYVDDFDLFLAHFDGNNDGRVVYDAARASAVGAGTFANEFTDDLQLARLIDKAKPDRDDDGEEGTTIDIALGYHNGILDAYDRYAKVRGRLGFAVVRADWESYHGESYQSIVSGPIWPNIGESAAAFEVTEDDMREITTAMFNESQNWFATQATGTLASGSGGTYTAPSDATWEEIPFGSAGKYDYYQRGIYDGYTFTNLRIPKGTNALFTNCTFIGVTYVETEADCTHYNWNPAGALMPNTDPNVTELFVEKFPGLAADLNGTPITDTRAHSNNLRFHNCTFIGSLSGDKPNEYTHWRNKIQLTGKTRFYIDANDPDLASQTDAATIINHINSIDPDDVFEMKKSSICMPGWSVDVGNFNNEQNADPTLTPKIKLKGTIIAGILDVRGTADVHGTLLMTFRPKKPTNPQSTTTPPGADPDAGPLAWGGLPDAFNTTIGYFGALDGDGEGADPNSGGFTGFGEITLRYDPQSLLPNGIPWPVRIVPDASTYQE